MEYPFRDQNHENMRIDLLIYFIFSNDLKKLDLSLHFRTMYAPYIIKYDRFENNLE